MTSLGFGFLGAARVLLFGGRALTTVLAAICFAGCAKNIAQGLSVVVKSGIFVLQLSRIIVLTHLRRRRRFYSFLLARRFHFIFEVVCVDSVHTAEREVFFIRLAYRPNRPMPEGLQLRR